MDKEIETLRAMPFAALGPRRAARFVSDTAEITRLPALRTELTIEATDLAELRRVRLRVEWGGTRRMSMEAETLIAAGRWMRAGGGP